MAFGGHSLSLPASVPALCNARWIRVRKATSVRTETGWLQSANRMGRYRLRYRPPVLGPAHATWSLSDKKCVIWRAGMAREKTLWCGGYAYKVCPSALRQGRWLAQADEKPPGNQVKRRREFVRFSAFEANSRQTLFPFIGYVVDRSNVSDYLSPAYIDF
jgi:hypothetical protein